MQDHNAAVHTATAFTWNCSQH